MRVGNSARVLPRRGTTLAAPRRPVAALLGSVNPLGQQLRVKGIACEIIGLIAPKGQAAMGLDQDDIVVLRCARCSAASP